MQSDLSSEPAEDEAGEPVSACLPDRLLRALDAWAGSQPDHMTRAEALRTILADWLAERGYLGEAAVEGLRPDELTSENDG